MKRLWSIFTEEMDRCMITGRTDHVERHHVFEGMQGFKKKSEKYGFIAPLHASVHPNGAFCSADNWKEIDNDLKARCQEYYLEHYGTIEEWYAEFGRFYERRQQSEDKNQEMQDSHG